MAQSWTFCLVYYAGLSWLALALVLSSRIGMGRPGVILGSPRWFAQQFHMLPWSIWWMNPSLQLGASALAFPFLSSAMVGECWFHHREAGLGSSWVAITCSSLYRVTARDSYSRCNISLELKDRRSGGSAVLWPCVRAPGWGVPGFLAGRAQVSCVVSVDPWCVLLLVWFVSQVSHAKRVSPKFENTCTDFDSSHLTRWTHMTRSHGPIGIRAKKRFAWKPVLGKL